MKRKKKEKNKNLKKQKLQFSKLNSSYEFSMPNYLLDMNGLPMTRNSVPTSDRIEGSCTKQSMPKVQIPEGKTIGIAYNKGNYQLVDKKDFNSMGKKI